jgi:ABC-type Fe3+/spermidine/putrescine transport system ATPase subunit
LDGVTHDKAVEVKIMPHLELKDLTKEFGVTKAVDHLMLTIEKGEFISLLGASGCGKTTTLRMIAGFAMPTHGNIFLDGKDITHVPARERKMGMVFQSYALFPTLTVFENICFGLRLQKQKDDQIKRKVGQLLETGHLEGLANRYPAQLSGGQQQRVALLRALAIEPSVLLLDEPLSNLDAKLRVEIRKEIRRLQSLLHITTVYVTHDQEEALAVSDKIAVMDQGIIQQCASPIEVYTHPANQFVSDFIGRSNFLICEVVAGKSIKFGGDTFSLDIPENLRSKSKVVLSFRPQHVMIHGTRGEIPSDFRGLVLNAKFSFETFLGTFFQLEALTTPEERPIMAEVPLEQRHGSVVQGGNVLLMTVAEEHIHMFGVAV